MRDQTFFNWLAVKFILFIIILLSFTMNFLFPQDKDNSNDDQLKYSIEVNAQVIPFFAVDKEGNPVFDIEEKDIELVINKKTHPFASFSRYKFHSEQPLSKISTVDKTEIYPERYVFLIIDKIFNSEDGLRRSKTIVTEIIKRSSAKDAFVLLLNTPGSGLRYLLGPERDINKLSQAIKKISLQREGDKALREANERVKKAKSQIAGFHDAGTTLSASRDKFSGSSYGAATYMERQRALKEVEIAKQELKENLKTFNSALVSLQYALRTITSSKIVYLISEGIPIGMMRGDIEISTDMIFYFDLLKTTAKVINFGGSILNVINPSKIQLMDYDYYSGKQSLKYLAEESGGKYFGGSDVNKIIKRVNMSTAAYYELTFITDGLDKEKMKIKINCKKPGIKIHSIVHCAKNVPYSKMKQLQKKLFALNIITEGSWSRMVGKVDKIKFKQLKSKDKMVRKIIIRIPKTMINKSSDIYSIHLDPVSMQANIEISNRKLNEEETLKVNISDKQRKHFFVIIEPTSIASLYNYVK